jgi:glycosyltransferase involved in cell wall biosynthesis
MATYHPGRFALLQDSVRCFLDQTYAHRELIIATDAPPWYRAVLARYASTLGSDVRLLAFDDGPHPLGAIRNRLLDAARGAVVCQWDDDDLCHPLRLETQLACMLQRDAAAAFLSDQLSFFTETRQLFWTDWAAGPYSAEQAMIPGTLMMHRDVPCRYPEDGPSARMHEDSALVSSLCGAVNVAVLSGAGYLSVYRHHGRNTFPEAHHRRIVADRTCARPFALARLEALTRALPYYKLPSPYLVCCAEDDVLFTHG